MLEAEVGIGHPKRKLFSAVIILPFAATNYALGWRVLKRPWANERALMHNGSTTMLYVVISMGSEKAGP